MEFNKKAHGDMFTGRCKAARNTDHFKGSSVFVAGDAACIFPKFPALLWEKRAHSWLSDFTAFVPGCVLGEQTEEPLWAALEEKRNGATPSVQGGKA